MSLNTLIAFLLAFGLFIFAIVSQTNNYLIFVDPFSFVMVIGGTLAATFLGQEYRYVMLALRSIFSMFAVYRAGRNVLNQDVGRLIQWGYLAQQKGLIGLEAEVKKVQGDEFLSFGVENLLSGYTGEELRETLEITADKTFERNLVPANILKGMGATAPAFGMIGTLVGLIIMLSSLGADPKDLGIGLAVALNTTLYGVLFARLILIPAASKLTQRQQIQRFRHELITEGLVMLAERRSPRYIADRMNSFLDPNIRFDIDKQAK
ncbi:MAG: flagellar motor protein MotA [Rhodospirillaceae bacterium]|jgi:chemotaxis protein MotA|uniref:motility protein A n=1 Tax=unclassified Hwanghaeella TaxID=2605944 RepID=UPI000C3E12F1|nr:flagellar motor protein MotA [Rhodospirillales bacterium]MAX48045.1 flagellar motor protein MotA [Rhodospirillaceae bacterium]|tara:strand:- start:1077 stop:1868 length:792 start_codon:yes stop_codon:yes gene_type:complete